VLLFAYDLGLEIGEWNIEGPGGLLEQIPYTQLRRWMVHRQVKAQLWNKATGKGKKGSIPDFWRSPL
jgi:hypothetical protein